MARTGDDQGPVAAIGLMSGTSMDGIDIALMRTDGERVVERGPAGTSPYEPAFRRRLAAALETAKTIERREQRPGELADIERELTRRHGAAVNAFLDEHKLGPAEIAVIGFHGQTVLHRPERGLTVQLGDGPLLAGMTGIPVVHDLRADDIAHGGQGAPLVPAYHRALVANLPAALRGSRPVAFVNIGGIANITCVGRRGELVAFDTGPGNALIDQWVAAHAGIPFDAGGAIAAEGAVLPALAARYLGHEYFRRRPPKSLDRDDFVPPAAHEASLEDGARTLAHVTAAAIWRAGDLLAERPGLWIVCGGGRHNRAIMDDLAALAARPAGKDDPPCEVVMAEAAGFDGDAMEAEAWAYLAVRSLKRLDISWPGTTGVVRPMSGGRLALPPARRAIPA
ncbi:MAG: anhydro-N-acetylmuramic acid kinase [Alphaproteobacteria bacterium]|nr:MAG: anhydro-N-acetylmuramic acid kinase [Alphaproteobacteria bacterium]